MKKILFILTIVYILLLCEIVMGDASCSVEIDFEIGLVTVSGEAGSDYTERDVSMIVIKDGNEITDIAQNKQGILNWYDETKTDTNGAFQFSYIMGGESGQYRIVISIDGMNTDIEKSLTFYGVTESADILAKIKSAISSGETENIDWIVSNRADFLQLDLTYFKKLSTSGKSSVYQAILKQNIEKIDDFKTEFYQISRVWYLNEINDINVYIDFFIQIKNDSFSTVDSIFESFDENVKNSIYNSMSETDYCDFPALTNGYNTFVIINKLNCSDNLWGDIYEILYKAKDILGIQFDNYQSLTSKSEAIKIMMKEIPFSNLTDIKDAFNSAVSKEANTERNKKEKPIIASSKSIGGGNDITITTNAKSVMQSNSNTSFNDLKSVGWAKESIEYLVEKGIVSGDGQGNFMPEKNITRAEFLKMVVLTLKIDSKADEIPFDDVVRNDWFYNYIAAGYSKNIIKGIDETKFDPNSFITRQDAAAIIFRAADLKDEINTNSIDFGDKNEIQDYAKNAVIILRKLKFINGFEDNTFRPNEYATRAEIANILYHLLEYLDKGV